MNIGMLLGSHYPSDIRVSKEANTLLAAGHNICLLCVRRKGEKYHENVGGITVNRIDAGKSLYEFAFWDIVTSFRFVHPGFKKHLPAFIKQNNIDILHVHDLPLAKTAILMKGRFPVKVVTDFHENYPEALKVWFSWRTNVVVKLKNRLFFNYEKWLKFEKYAVDYSDHIIAVVDEMKERLMEKHGTPKKKITVITNTENKSFAERDPDPDIFGKLKTKYKVLYTGGLGPHRGVDTAIQGMKYLDEFPDIYLIIIGSGSNAVMQKLKLLAKENQVEERVIFLGYQPFSLFYSYMSAADINIIPHLKNGHTDNTVPHKLFQGMMSKKPLLVSSSTPLKRIIGEAEAGLVFQAGDPEDFARQVKFLFQHAEKCQQFAENGYHTTFNGSYNWEETGKALTALYEALGEKIDT